MDIFRVVASQNPRAALDFGPHATPRALKQLSITRSVSSGVRHDGGSDVQLVPLPGWSRTGSPPWGNPIVLEVPYDDHWYLVVDSNDRTVRIKYTEIFD